MGGIAEFLHPGGMLLVIARGRDAADDEGQMPWPLTREELENFSARGCRKFRLRIISIRKSLGAKISRGFYAAVRVIEFHVSDFVRCAAKSLRYRMDWRGANQVHLNLAFVKLCANLMRSGLERSHGSRRRKLLKTFAVTGAVAVLPGRTGLMSVGANPNPLDLSTLSSLRIRTFNQN